MRISTIAFDAYGTLIDTADGSVRARQKILLKNDCDLDPNEVYTRWNTYHQQIISTLSAFTFEEAIFVAGLSRIYHDYGIAGDPREDVHIMLATLGRRKAFADTLPCLQNLRGRFELVIASNTDSLPFLEDLWNDKLVVDKWFTSESLQAYKPHRAFYERLLGALGRAPREVVFVGDSLDADVIGPMACGMQGIWLNRKRTRQPEAHAVHEISTLAELDSVITMLQATAQPTDGVGENCSGISMDLGR
jgi:2-haloalkanoic acid dehalogenase type II